MKYNISHWFASMVSIPVAIVAGLASMIAFDIHLVYDMLIAAGGFFAAYFPSQSNRMKSKRKKMGIKKRENKDEKKVLGEGREKIKSRRKIYKNVRTLKDAKVIYNCNWVTRRINSSVEDNPKLFLGVQEFSH